MNLMRNGIAVYASRSTRAKNLVAILSIIALPVGLVLYGWFFQDLAATILFLAFGVFVAGCTLLFIYKNKILRFDSAAILTIGPDGLELPGHKILSWQAIEAILFTYDGVKAIGFRLRADLPPRERSELEANFAHGFDWQSFGVPLTLQLSGLSLSGEELLAQLREHNVEVLVAEKEITLGNESDLANAQPIVEREPR
jgi:hypothetical protein